MHCDDFCCMRMRPWHGGMAVFRNHVLLLRYVLQKSIFYVRFPFLIVRINYFSPSFNIMTIASYPPSWIDSMKWFRNSYRIVRIYWVHLKEYSMYIMISEKRRPMNLLSNVNGYNRKEEEEKTYVMMHIRCSGFARCYEASSSMPYQYIWREINKVMTTMMMTITKGSSVPLTLQHVPSRSYVYFPSWILSQPL